MEEILARIWHNLGDRITGPMSFRLILQPSVAMLLAIRGGLQDARERRRPYFWSILTRDRAARRERVREGWTVIGKVFCLAAVLDTIYQLIVQRWVYPFEALLVAFLLACVPYLVVRGSVTRLAAKAAPETQPHHL
jgi:hypothetical protein